ncbi:malto-oligosyltrehalose trehalohydrolase [Herbiconiux sp. KACC 21604]|uniref:malto-oligosyltrehalose trehalohydrolase n=1 Tax=unclassified Herbiconiux TaxID=2618217 RepID=UPI001492A414|nr:malto-oligosyltrehalose trehalohydrolase [Herbiconiux sp. SALV-R1]QJU52900.1 malto-oligosyltrehalose trehalohydrolase [Herbiconiux sp. SALV-R1]WPO87820.1 malto-oligosyltrehalose trehalohydrolase [Herbiconiux sp. KACC 21604]
MTENDFAVWAPRPARVELLLREAGAGSGAGAARIRTVPLHKGDDGWWRPEEGAVTWKPGVDYGYLLDGQGPYPDPRSRRQPDGVHGLSRTDDPATFEWSDGSWTGLPVDRAVIYELHVGTFTPKGTLASARKRLDHLRSIGVTHVELLPVNGFNGVHNWGYDGVAWFTVHEAYGGPEGYRAFVDACHAAGLAVIQDVVYNHLGPSGNYLPLYGPYLNDASSNTWGTSVNLDHEGSAEVRRFILDNALMWLRDYHVDGLRLDAVHALVDDGPVHLLAELSAEVEELSASTGVQRMLIAESDLNDPVMFRARDDGGYGLDGQWSDDFHHAVHVNLTGETSGYYADFDSVGALAKVLTKGFFHDGTYSSFREREHGVELDRAATAPWRLVVASQNHDQIGNRAIGDRLTATLGVDDLAIAAALTLLGPFTPMLFMGEEWAASTPWQFFTSHPEPELGEATATGRIAEFERMGWDESAVPDPQDPETFTRSKLDWHELDDPAHPEHRAMLEVYRALARVRATLPPGDELRLAEIAVEFSEEERWLVLTRPTITLVVNFSDEPRELATIAPGAGEVLVDTHALLHPAPPSRHAGRPLDIAPHSVIVTALP